jgi:protein TonB
MSPAADRKGFYRAPGPVLRPGLLAVVFAAVLAGVTLSILPFFELVAARDYGKLTLRPAPDVVPAPPAPEEERPGAPEESRPPPRPQLEAKPPRLERPRRQIDMLRAQLSVSMTGLSAGLGDFALDFDVEPGVEEPAAEEGFVYQLAQLDSPPRPLVRMDPEYPRSARRRRIEGFVELVFVITPEGRVADIDVVRSEPGDVFVAEARAAVKRWRFTQPLKNGKPVAVRARQVIRFELQ